MNVQLRAALALLLASVAAAQTPPVAPVVPAVAPLPAGEAEAPIALAKLFVVSRTDDPEFDPTGMDGPEVELNEPPFSNDFLTGTAHEDELAMELNTEISFVSGATPADIAAGVSRLNLKGFPTPRLRNGFTQAGVPEVLNAGGTEVIMGPLTSVTGKAAPGGIANLVTARPRGKSFSKVELGATAHSFRRLETETNATLKPKRVWARLAATASERHGPEPFSFNRQRGASGTVIWRLNRAMSTMLALDYDERAANVAAGPVEWRPSRLEPIVAPYAPLAYLGLAGPHAGLRKRTASASLQFEGQLGRRLTLRAGVQALSRALDEDRWTAGQFLLDTRKLGGIREPQHTAQPLRAALAHAELTARLALKKSDHKLTFSAETSHVGYARTQRALERADRDTLPDDVRFFDPAAPNYARPAYDPARFTRLITDRTERADYAALAGSERAAFAGGRLVLTAGARRDFVAIDVRDRRPTAPQPRATDATGEFSRHLGGNWIARPGRLLVFANTSTAFEPSTRVDARTGHVQGNETTLGHELGAKLLFLDRRANATLLLFDLRNRNISRRNPRYDDPVLDAAQTQPQLLAGAAERFTGGLLEARVRPVPAWVVTLRGSYTHAITTRSPDTPEETGRALTRLPRLTGGLSTRYSLGGEGKKSGLSLSARGTYVSGFVASYETVSHRYLAYPGYALLGVGADYGRQVGRTRHALGVNVSNALDKNLLALLNRPAAGREVSVSYAVVW